jgi:mycothiol synthase
VNVRPPTLADADAVGALVAAYDRAHGCEPDMSADDLREEWAHLDLERDAWLLEADGRLAGYGCIYGRGTERLTTDGYTHPELRGRGVGGAILQLAEARARERGAARLHNASLHADTAARALFEANGYAYIRSFFRMGIALDTEPSEPAALLGVTLRPLSEADDEAVHATVEEAFQDHWEHVPRDFEAWRRRQASSDRSLWRGAWAGDELVGVSVNDLERYGGGWIGTVATRRAWRGRGIAQALLRASFRELYRRGQRRVRLGVDASNPTGAVRVYERVGMGVVWRADVFEKHL